MCHSTFCFSLKITKHFNFLIIFKAMLPVCAQPWKSWHLLVLSQAWITMAQQRFGLSRMLGSMPAVLIQLNNKNVDNEGYSIKGTYGCQASQHSHQQSWRPFKLCWSSPFSIRWSALLSLQTWNNWEWNCVPPNYISNISATTLMNPLGGAGLVIIWHRGQPTNIQSLRHYTCIGSPVKFSQLMIQ